jgi:hypothetical protein
MVTFGKLNHFILEWKLLAIMQQISLQKEWVRVALCAYCLDKFFNPFK